MTKQTEALRLAIKNMEQCDMGITILLEGLAKFGVPKDILRLDKESVLVPAIKACKEALVEDIHQAKLDAYNSASSRLYKEALAKTHEAPVEQKVELSLQVAQLREAFAECLTVTPHYMVSKATAEKWKSTSLWHLHTTKPSMG